MMKAKSRMRKKWSVRMVVVIAAFMNVLAIQANYAAYTETEKIEVNGRWKEKAKSLVPTCPITVYTDGAFLYIENESPDRDITIRLTQEATGTIVHEQNCTQAQTAYIAIPISTLSAGAYRIECIGSPIGYLSGYFTKY